MTENSNDGETKTTMSKKYKEKIRLETEIIKRAIEQHGVNYILESKSLDMIAALIYKKYIKRSNPNIKNEEQGSNTSFLSTLLTIFFIISISLSIASMLGYDPKELLGTLGEKKGSDDSVIAGPFEFKTCKNLTKKPYFGQRKLFDRWRELTTSTIYDIFGGKTREELDEQPVYIKLNFALFGEPGTGKTFFVQSLAKEIDNELKLRYYLQKKQSKIKRRMEDLTEEEKNDILAKEPSRVRFCEVQPGDVNGKYVGESEGNIKLLFKKARELADKEWTAVFLFFDEGDVFFNQRTSGSDGGSSSATNVKSELLTKIGVMTSEKYLPIFVFTATNRMSEFDSAFKRRFANQHEFKTLDYEERLEFIDFLLSEFKLSSLHKNLIANYTANKNQSYISEKVKLYITHDSARGKKVLKFKEYIEFLKANAESQNMV